MSERTNIAWCDSTVNFWRGCTKVSPGCTNCYAEALVTTRLQGEWGKGKPRVRGKGAVADALAFNRKPWICDECGEASKIQFENTEVEKHFCSACKKPVTMHRRRIFSLSLGDWLDEEVPVEWLGEMLDTIRQCDQVTWILCSKRPENFIPRMMECLNWGCHTLEKNEANAAFLFWLKYWVSGDAPKNIILLTSVENQAMADLRIPQLLKIPAACHGLSLEPLLEPVNLSGMKLNWGGKLLRPVLFDLDWLIIGCESGTKRRDSCTRSMVQSLVDQGRSAGAAVFVKQILVEGRVEHDVKKFVPSLQVQEWPKIAPHPAPLPIAPRNAERVS